MRAAEAVIDIDGVLADFEGHFCEVFGERDRHLVGLDKRYPEHKRKIEQFVQKRDTYKYLDPIQVGLEIVDWLSKQGIVIHIVSSRPVGTFEITRHWLNSYHVPYTTLTINRDKIAKIKAIQPDFIVDDIISVVEGCYYQASIPGVLVAQPWNQATPFFPRVENIQEFISVFERMADADPNLSSHLRRVWTA